MIFNLKSALYFKVADDDDDEENEESTLPLVLASCLRFSFTEWKFHINFFVNKAFIRIQKVVVKKVIFRVLSHANV
jgi:hypothetical protein